MQARVQQQRPAAGKKGGKAAAKQDAGVEQRGGAEGAEERELVKEEEDCRELVAIAGAEVEEAVGKLRALDVACLREQLDVRVLLQLARVVAEAAGGQAGAGGAGMGAALAGLLQERIKELHPAALVQVGSALYGQARSRLAVHHISTQSWRTQNLVNAECMCIAFELHYIVFST